ncbi:hypothetical protein LEP1GSC176_1919 [Leptospira kirschneri str. MMD1493]|nr:hypothetical protein LEP1GSC176_1919 [Leptospira kirschneri str. MMD1493]
MLLKIYSLFCLYEQINYLKLLKPFCESIFKNKILAFNRVFYI